MRRAARRPIDVPSMRTDGERGMEVAGERQVAEADHRQPIGNGDSLHLRLDQDAEREQVRAAEDRVDARMAREQVDEPGAAAAQRRRRAHDARRHARRGRPWRAPWRAPPRRNPSCGAAPARRRRSATARRRRPRETRCSTTAAPIFSCENPTSMSIGASASGPRSRSPECPRPAAGAGPPPECTIPVRTMPSGRRPMIASSSASSRDPL